MSVLKATAICPNAQGRDALLAQARGAAAGWNVRPGREATVELAPEVDPNAIRAKAICVDDAEGNRVYGIVEAQLVAANVRPGSNMHLTLDDGTAGQHREW